jgi:NAD(P)-dependent dehydrogenase (short-subunit alcohol dehydrogenase family)
MKKNVLITGGSGNLGKAAVEKFLSEGYQIIATVSPGKGLGFEAHGSITTYEADLTNEKSVQDVIEKIVQDYNTIHIAVLTVGGFATGSIEIADGAILQKMISLNFNTSYFIARLVFIQMVRQSFGRIVFVGSRPALLASEGKSTIAYALSKSLIFKLSELLNAEAAGLDVVTSVIVPGTIDTLANRTSNPNADFSAWVTPEEISSALVYLTSSEAKSIREPILKLYSNS